MPLASTLPWSVSAIACLRYKCSRLLRAGCRSFFLAYGDKKLMDLTNPFVLAAVAVLIVVLVYAVMLYNQLVNIKHAVSQAWANIDVLLRQRHDELPKPM